MDELSSTDRLALALFYEQRLREERTAAEARGDRFALRDVEAKMRILNSWKPPADVKERVRTEPSPYREMDIAEAHAIDHVVRVLAAVYEEHEDYRAGWAS